MITMNWTSPSSSSDEKFGVHELQTRKKKKLENDELFVIPQKCWWFFTSSIHLLYHPDDPPQPSLILSLFLKIMVNEEYNSIFQSMLSASDIKTGGPETSVDFFFRSGEDANSCDERKTPVHWLESESLLIFGVLFLFMNRNNNM